MPSKLGSFTYHEQQLRFGKLFMWLGAMDGRRDSGGVRLRLSGLGFCQTHLRTTAKEYLSLFYCSGGDVLLAVVATESCQLGPRIMLHLETLLVQMHL